MELKMSPHFGISVILFLALMRLGDTLGSQTITNIITPLSFIFLLLSLVYCNENKESAFIRNALSYVFFVIQFLLVIFVLIFTFGMFGGAGAKLYDKAGGYAYSHLHFFFYGCLLLSLSIASIQRFSKVLEVTSPD